MGPAAVFPAIHRNGPSMALGCPTPISRMPIGGAGDCCETRPRAFREPQTGRSTSMGGDGVHWKGIDLRGDPSSGKAGGCRRLPKRLGAVTVGYKCH